MKITCNKSDLLNGVNIALKGVSQRTTLSILQYLYLSVTNTGFKIMSNDLELGIETTINANLLETGTVCLEAKIFSEIVRKLPDAEVEISVDENNHTIIKCGKAKFNISGLPGAEFITLPEIEKSKYFSIDQLSLKEMIRQTIFSISLEEIRPVLTGELIEIKENQLAVVSIDGFRISIRNKTLDPGTDNIKIIIPGKTLNEISKLLVADDTEFIDIYYTDKHVIFNFENTVVVSRLLTGEFPNYQQIFSKDCETLITVDRKNMLMSLERAALVARDSNKNPVKLAINENVLIITSNTEIGNVYEEVDIQTEGDNLEIAFNPKYLIDALKVIDDDLIVFQFTNAFNPCIIRQVEGEDYKYLVLPIRINI